MNFVEEVEFRTRGYASKGNKEYRGYQRARMIDFAKHAATLDVRSSGQMGKFHVVAYWKTHRDLNGRTAYAHWLAIRELWRILDKPGEPPRPRVVGNANILEKNEK